MSNLSELLEQAKPEDMSLREVARQANKRGYKLTAGTLSKYFQGMHGTPDESTILALHEVLRIPLKDLRTAAELPTGADEPYTPPSEANRLDLRQRHAVDEIIRLLAREGTTTDDQSATTPQHDDNPTEDEPEVAPDEHQRPTKRVTRSTRYRAPAKSTSRPHRPKTPESDQT